MIDLSILVDLANWVIFITLLLVLEMGRKKMRGEYADRFFLQFGKLIHAVGVFILLPVALFVYFFIPIVVFVAIKVSSVNMGIGDIETKNSWTGLFVAVFVIRWLSCLYFNKKRSEHKPTI